MTSATNMAEGCITSIPALTQTVLAAIMDGAIFFQYVGRAQFLNFLNYLT